MKKILCNQHIFVFFNINNQEVWICNNCGLKTNSPTSNYTGDNFLGYVKPEEVKILKKKMGLFF
jgi:hypothetical protein